MVAQAGLRLCCWQAPKTDFLALRPICRACYTLPCSTLFFICYRSGSERPQTAVRSRSTSHSYRKESLFYGGNRHDGYLRNIGSNFITDFTLHPSPSVAIATSLLNYLFCSKLRDERYHENHQFHHRLHCHLSFSCQSNIKLRGECCHENHQFHHRLHCHLL